MRWLPVAAAVLVCGALAAVGLGDDAFWDDEANTAIFARNLLATGELSGWDGTNLIGYRAAPVVPVYAPLPGMGHLVDLTMLASIYFFGAGGMNTWITTKVRHNMLTGLLIWALSHLLVHGDLASVVLFGAMAAYSLASMLLISRATPWTKPVPKGTKQEVILIVATLVLYGVITAIHIWLGHNPFLGSYS